MFSTSYGPTKTAAEALDPDEREEFHQAWLEFFEQRRVGDEVVHHREYLLTLGTAANRALALGLRRVTSRPVSDVVTMDKIVSLARRRGFVFPSSRSTAGSARRTTTGTTACS